MHYSMYHYKRNYIHLCCIFFAAFASCSVTKNIPAGDALYDGAVVQIKAANDSVKVSENEIEAELKSLLRPKPNAAILGIKYKLLMYNAAGTPTGHGFRYWLKNKLGEPPVLASGVNFDKNMQLLANRLANRGFFKTLVTLDTSTKNKKLDAVYQATIHARYSFNKIEYLTDSTEFGNAFNAVSKNTLLKKGNAYDLDLIKAERDRIDGSLKERGFYFFNPDYIIADADSAKGNHQVDMRMRTKKETPAKAKEVYRIGDVVVFADYKLENDTAHLAAKEQSFYTGRYHIYDPEKKFKPLVFNDVLVFKPGDIYKRSDHNLSLNRLISLGMYKFVKARFTETDSAGMPLLDAYYYLTPLPRQSLRFEVSGLSKSNNSTGTELSLSWRSRNTFHHAEIFSATVFGGFEKQIAAQQPTVNTNRLGVELSLTIPRIIGPYRVSAKSNFVPQTKFLTGYEWFYRNTQYTLNSFKASFSYIWRESILKEHRLDILSVNFVRPSSISPEFQDSLENNITLARSIEKQFIIGSNYNFNYNTQMVPNRKRSNFYFNGNLNLSGNIIGLITGANVAAGNQKKLFGTPFSQFIRTEADFRYYLKFGKSFTWASRAVSGIGYAYGNSTTLPFIKAFFAGGVNDIRAFRARSLGPGSYYGGNAAIAGFLPDQPGDIKMGLSTEFRAKLFSVIHGAIFSDAGNIWLLRENPQVPGGKFTSKFLNQFAVGIGAGLRIDVSFFVLRLDVSFPVRKPYVQQGSKWVFDEIDFSSEQWRKENIIYNLAIGYPF